MHNALGWACAGMLAGSCLAAGGCSHPPAAQTVAADAAPVVGVVEVGREDLARTLKLAAEFKPYQDIAVNAKVSGYVEAIHVDVGDHVRQGQLLAVLEVPELQDQLRQAEAAVAQNQQGVQHAQFLLVQAQASHEASHLEYARLSSVIKTQPGLVAQQEVDDAQGKDQAAEAQVDAAQAALAGAREQLVAAQAERERVNTMFAYARITAPFAGVITNRYADTGAMIQAGTTQAMPVVRLAEEDVLRLGIPVPESSVPLIHLGMPAQVEVDSLHQTFSGKVARFADQVAFDTRTMYTEIDVDNPKGVLVPGMYAYATLDLDQRHQVLAVPVQAINRQASGATVMVVDARSRVATVPVQLGMETPNAVEVLGGLQAGERVVVSGGSLVHPGQTVQPEPAALPTAAGGNS